MHMGKKIRNFLVLGAATVAATAVVAKKQKEQKAQGKTVNGIDCSDNQRKSRGSKDSSS